LPQHALHSHDKPPLDLLDAGSGSSLDHVIAAWAAVQALHILFRRQALAQLVFPTLSRKRVCALVSEHVRGAPLSSPAEVNACEPLWEASSSMEPAMDLGCGLERLIKVWRCRRPHEGSLEEKTGKQLPSPSDVGAEDKAKSPPGHLFDSSIDSVDQEKGWLADRHLQGGWLNVPPDVQPFVDLYRDEQYMMAWCDGKAAVCLKQSAGHRAVLRAFWQAAWLRDHHSLAGRESNASPGQGGSQKLSIYPDVQLDLLQESLRQLNSMYELFELDALGKGWILDVVNIKGGAVRVALSSEHD